MGLEAGEATARVHRVIRRLAFELFWLRAEQTALRELGGRDHAGLDFFRVAYTGIEGDWLLRLVRVLDDRPGVAAFWYLARTVSVEVEEALKQTPVGLPDIRSLSDRVKLIRDKVFVHIDKDGVFDPDALYVEANITGQEMERVVGALWAVINDLHVKAFDAEYKREPDYTGADIERLHALYLERVAPSASNRSPFPAW